MFVVLALFCVFAVCALLLAAIGAGVYRNTAAVMESNYNERTSILYVAEKLRQNDVAGAVRIDSVGASDALVLVEQVSGRNYETWLFVADGTLYEELLAPGGQPEATMGQAIMPMRDLRISANGLGDGCFTVSFTTVDGQVASMDFNLASTEVGEA
jgi:hypothetical protein